jgi:uncharacterized protein YdaU (DUF1376 family)
MFYYQFNIGDYATHTRHLSPMEDLAYRRLLDWYYLHEKPIPSSIDQAARVIQLNECLTDVEQVLNEFFVLSENGWISSRADKEINKFHKKIVQASEAGKASAKAKSNGRSTDVQPTNNQEPITNNHKPSNSNTLAIGKPNCPHEEIIKLYHTHLPIMPEVKVWTEKRKALLKARWIEEEKRQSLEFWEKFFKYVSASDFLCGRSGTWQASLEWMLNATNFVKIIEGNYENRKL